MTGSGLGDISEEDALSESEQERNSSSSSSTSRSGDTDSKDEFPRYFEETPFFAVIQTSEGLIARNEPPLSITYRQYSKGSDSKLWEPGMPDEIEKYWMTDWMFKKDRHIYEKEFSGHEFVSDLRSEPRKTLNRLEDAITEAEPQSLEERAHTCSVCGDTLNKNDSYERVFGRYVHRDHTVADLADADLIGFKQLSNRRWD